MTRKNKSLAATVPINFLLTCSDASLMSVELKYLDDAANSRKRLHEILDQLIHETAQASIARWFRTQGRQQIIREALEHPKDILAWAREEIREGQRSEAERLMPESALEPGAHIEALKLAKRVSSMQYQQKNVAEGNCRVCAQPLDRNSVLYCEKHLAMKRAQNERHTRKKQAEKARKE